MPATFIDLRDGPDNVLQHIQWSDKPLESRIRAATYPLNVDDATQLAGDDDPKVRAVVAANTCDMPTAIIRLLAQDADASVRRRVATRSDLPPDVIDRLSTDEPAVVLTLAKNRYLVKPAVLTYLVRHPDLNIRAAIATNPHLTAWQIQRLAKDSSVYVRNELAFNPLMRTNTNPNTIAKVGTDDD